MNSNKYISFYKTDDAQQETLVITFVQEEGGLVNYLMTSIENTEGLSIGSGIFNREA